MLYVLDFHCEFTVFRFLFYSSGAEVYSSELLLNGIVTQKLEYERLVLLFILHEIFVFVEQSSVSSHSWFLLNLGTVSGTVSLLTMLGKRDQRYGSKTAKESSNAVAGEGGNVIKLLS